jgi:arabinogalactan oligomer/maltooligosaccharide transport system substrate-binding protein
MEKKCVLPIVAALCLAAVFAGCAKKPETVVLTVWESTEGPDEFIKQAGAAYTASHPGVSIKFVNVELGDSHTQIALDGPAGVGPDLFAAPHDTLGELVVNGHVLPAADPGRTENRILGSCLTATT